MVELVIRVSSEATALNSVCLMELFGALDQTGQERVISLTRDLLSGRGQGPSAQATAD